jgi:hypothetical protein
MSEVCLSGQQQTRRRGVVGVTFQPFLWTGVVVAEMVTQILLLPLMVYAACGLILSLAVHLMALAGLQPPGGNALFFGLHVGIFPLWLPVVLIMMKLTKGMKAVISA